MPEFDRAAIEDWMKQLAPFRFDHLRACLKEIDRLNALREAEMETNVDMARSALSCYRRGLEDAIQKVKGQAFQYETPNTDRAIKVGNQLLRNAEEAIRGLMDEEETDATG
jgi:hypothetical protein